MGADKVIAEYIAAYVEANGMEPKVERRGSWIVVNRYGKYRTSQLALMTSTLKLRAQLKEPRP